MSTINDLLQQGWRLHQAGQVDVAEEHYRQALAREPDNADALVYLGIALFDKREFDQSIAAYRRAIEIRSDFPVAWNNLGNSLRMNGDLEQAEACFAKALQQRPGYLSALKNRGTLWIWSGEIEKGLYWYEQGLKVDPRNAELHRNLGVIHLLMGNYETGWDEYRWRWKMSDLFRPAVPAPVWKGEPLLGKTILVYPEQGLGDAIHFVRMTTALKEQGATVLLMCARRMIPLFTSAAGVDRLVLDSAPPPPVDYHASLIEVLDVIYGQTGQIPWGTSLFQETGRYLTVSEALIDYWKRWLDQQPGEKKIGINWQGNPDHHADVYRSVPLQIFRPLSQLAGIRLVNLQFGYGSEQLEHCDFGDAILRLPDHADTDGAFTDTAAILQNLDGLVTTDTAVAHLAGAVGARVLLMLGRVPDWRWLLEGQRTAWYPTVELVRQAKLGHWQPVIQTVCRKLTAEN